MKDVTQIDPVALRTLATAVRLGTFEATARELHVTPSAVSQRIKALETHVGRVLVHRVKPLEATEAGHVLVRLAAQTELLEREAVAELLEGEEPDDDDPFVAVPIAVNADALYTWLIDALVAVQSEHRVTFEVVREDQSRTTERLRRGDVMAAVTSDPRPVPGCRVVRARLDALPRGCHARPGCRRTCRTVPVAAALGRAPDDRVRPQRHAAARLPEEGDAPAPDSAGDLDPVRGRVRHRRTPRDGLGDDPGGPGPGRPRARPAGRGRAGPARPTCRSTGSTGAWSRH